MGRTKNSVYFSILQLLIFGVFGQDRLLVDVESDIPRDGTWDIDCDNGYAELSTDFACDPNDGGTILIPPEELNGEKGFWTVCAPYGCKLKYHVQPGDTLFKARVYQSDIDTEVSFDGIVWDFITGKGWVEFEETLGVAGKNEVSLRFSHFSANSFNILDKIVINGDFDPPTTPNPTTEVTTETTELSSSTEITTEATTETTEVSETMEVSSTTEMTTEEDFSSSTDSTTTSQDISSTTDLDTTSDTTTEDDSDSSSTVSDDPIGSSSEPSTSDGPEVTSSTVASTITTDNPTSSSTDETRTSTTDNPSTENSSTTSSETSSLPTSESTSDTTESDITSVTPPPSPCTDPPCFTSSMRPSTTKKPSNSSGFINGLGGKLLFSAIGVFLFILLSACCLRFVCVRGGVLRRRKSKKDDLEDIISQNGSSNANISGKTSPNMNSSDRELYLYMNRYPYLINPSVQKANHVPNKIQISSVPPPSTSPSSSSSTPWSPRAIYRESTPYMAFDELNSGKNIENVPSSTNAMNYDYVETSRPNQTTNMSPSHLPKKKHTE